MRSFFLIISIVLGLIFHQASVLSFLIKWLLSAMLFFSFLNLKISFKSISLQHLLIAVANIAFGTLVFFVIKPFNLSIALAASIIALAPTAIAAPVMASLLKANVTWLALSTIVTNMLVALLLPFYIPYVYGIDNNVGVLVLMKSLATIFFIPFILAQIIQKHSPYFLQLFSKFKNATFSLFVGNIFLASAKSSNFILFETEVSNDIIIYISLFTAIICCLNFSIGSILGRKKNKLEASLAFGQKNTMFAVWIALTYINPLVSLAPMSYVLFQNIYLSLLLYRRNKK